MSMEGTPGGWPLAGDAAPREAEAVGSVKTLEALIAANFERFARDPLVWAQYYSRGITPTGNLRLLFDESQKEYWQDGAVRNPNHRGSRPYGHIIDRLQAEHPELYARAVDANAAYEAHSAQFTTDAQASVDTRLLLTAIDAAAWHTHEVMSEVFAVIAPQIAAEGYDPRDACK